MNDHIKFQRAIKNLGFKEYSYRGESPVTEELFNKIEWVTGVGANEVSTTTTVNPHSHLTWDKVNAEMQQVQTAHDALSYARKRGGEYPPLTEFVEAYTEKEFGGDSTKMDAYKIKYEKVRSDNPK